MALIYQPEVEMYVGNTARLVLRKGGVDLTPHDVRPGDIFLSENEAVQLAQAILRRYDVTAAA